LKDSNLERLVAGLVAAKLIEVKAFKSMLHVVTRCSMFDRSVVVIVMDSIDGREIIVSNLNYDI